MKLSILKLLFFFMIGNSEQQETALGQIGEIMSLKEGYLL